MTAVEWKHIDVVQYFLEEKKANLYIKDGEDNYFTALDIAKKDYNVNQDLLNYLKEWDRDILEAETELLDALVEGKLNRFKSVLDKENAYQVLDKFGYENAGQDLDKFGYEGIGLYILLSDAELGGYIDICDYLIRYHYAPKHVSVALSSYSRYGVLSHYYAVYNLFLKEAPSSGEIKSLLRNAEAQLKPRDLYYARLITLWMMVSNRSEAFIGMPQIYQLKQEHQYELKSHMEESTNA